MYQNAPYPQISVVTTLLNHRVTREMVRARTLELASLAGRGCHEILQVDYERAKRELTGETDFDRQQAMLDLRDIC